MNWKSLTTVAFVCVLMLVLSFSYSSLFLPALYHENPKQFWYIMPCCLISLMIAFFSYFRAVWTSPGYPWVTQKSSYSQRQISDMKYRHEQQFQYKKLVKENNATSFIRRNQIKNLTQNSYCEKCDNVKTSRTHHCKVCKRCIQRMDHHCPWTGNCVGKYNHKFFLLFLFYVTIALLIVTISIIVDFINPEQPVLTRIWQIDELYYLIILVTGGMCTLLMLTIGFLLISQFMLMVHNITTLESFYGEIYQNNPFTKNSLIQHMKQIMGESWWLIPTKPFPGQKQQINVAFTSQ